MRGLGADPRPCASVLWHLTRASVQIRAQSVPIRESAIHGFTDRDPCLTLQSVGHGFSGAVGYYSQIDTLQE